ncbi:MAG: pyridoxamine 5'-phosphate oxidase family protein [Acidimicrobiia bacterium]
MKLAEVITEAVRLGPILYLATAAGGVPHVVPLAGGWADRKLYVSVGSNGRTARNLGDNTRVCVHFEVKESTGWDSLIIWGDVRLLRAVEDKVRLWTGVLPYDLDDFDPGGPHDSPNTCFVEISPARALLLLRYGMEGRRRWQAADGDYER